MTKISNFILFLIIIAMLGAAYVMLLPPTWIIDKQLGALKANDIDRAYGYTSETFKKSTSYLDFKDFVESVPALRDSQGMAIHEELTDREHHQSLIVKGILRTSDAKQIPIEYTIIREDSPEGFLEGWKIETIKIEDQGEWKTLPMAQNSESEQKR